jgi:hypothetical protein
MRLGTAELPEDLANAVRPVDPSALGLRTASLDALREHSVRQQATQEEMLRGIAEGDTPTLSLAAVNRSDIGAVWMRLARRPCGFGYSPIDAVDVRDAHQGLTRGFIVEPTALFTVGDLGGEAGDQASEAIAAHGRVTQAGLDDLDAGVTSLLPEVPTMTRLELTFDPATGQPIPINWPPELVEVDHRRARRMLELGQQLPVEPDPGPNDESQLREAFDATAPTALRVLISTAVAAQRTGLPVYSEDRNVRLLFRDIGTPVFGTPALLEALRDTGELTDEAMWRARTRLRASGYAGVTPDDAEIRAAVDAAGGDCSEALRLAFYDPGPWKGEYGGQVRRIVGVLQHAFTTYPEHFEKWMIRLLAAMLDGAPLNRVPPGPPPKLRESLEWHAEWLLVGAWAAVRNDDPDRREFLQRVRDALDRAARDLGASIDPLIGAADRYGRLRVQIGAATEPGIPLGLLAALPLADVMRLFGVDPRRQAHHRAPTMPPSGVSAELKSRIARINERSTRNPRQRPSGR